MTKQLTRLWSDCVFKPHQCIGVHWMLQRERMGGGGLLCDDMGLGKTIQIAGLLKNGAQKMGEETLIITPVAVLQQWIDVIRRSNMRVYTPSKSGVSWGTSDHNISKLAPRAYIIGYEAALRKPTLVKGYHWDRLVYDEAHRLASDNSNTALASSFDVKRIWMLTGTPIVNKLRDLVILLQLVGVTIPRMTDMKILSTIIKTNVLSRSMDQLRASIPNAPATPLFHTISLEFSTPEERDFYAGMSGIITKRWKALDGDSGGEAALERLKLFMRLRQLSLHPQIYISARKKTMKGLYTRPDWEGTSTKFEAIENLVCKSDKSHKWIIFCHFRQEMEMLSDMLKANAAIELVQTYHGGLTHTQKEDVISRSHLPLSEGKQEVMLVQLQSGGTGLNLQHFDRIVFTGPWWTSALMEQAVGRAVRIGQKEVVNVYRIHLKEEEAMNIDTYMLQKADTKGGLCKEILSYANTECV